MPKSPTDSYFDVALICRNGHVITHLLEFAPTQYAKFCETCGTATIQECPQCDKPIRGQYNVPGVFSVGEIYRRPAFCVYCGASFPWLSASLDAARELADELEILDPDEKELLKSSLDDIVSDTPRTSLASTRIKRLLGKAGHEGAKAMHQILIGVITEVAKKQMGM